MAGFTDHFEQMTIIKVHFIVEVLAVDYNFFLACHMHSWTAA